MPRRICGFPPAWCIARAIAMGQHQGPLAKGAADSVSKRTEYVVMGAEAGSKARRVAELGVETLSEQAWLELIGGA